MSDTEMIDADGHVYEDDREIFEFLEAPFRGKRTVLGFPFWPTIDGFQRGAIHAHMGLHSSFECSAPLWLEFLERTGISKTVLYPTAGLAHNLIRAAVIQPPDVGGVLERLLETLGGGIGREAGGEMAGIGR